MWQLVLVEVLMFTFFLGYKKVTNVVMFTIFLLPIPPLFEFIFVKKEVNGDSNRLCKDFVLVVEEI